MKTSFMAMAIASLFLTACSLQPQSTDNVEVLTPGLMEPVVGSGATQGSYSWPSDVQSTAMPASMQ